MTISHRYVVQYSVRNGYAVYDQVTKKEIFWNTSKSMVIGHSQAMNGFQPIDGKEETYAGQISLKEIKDRMTELEDLPNPFIMRKLVP